MFIEYESGHEILDGPILLHFLSSSGLLFPVAIGSRNSPSQTPNPSSTTSMKRRGEISRDDERENKRMGEKTRWWEKKKEAARTLDSDEKNRSQSGDLSGYLI